MDLVGTLCHDVETGCTGRKLFEGCAVFFGGAKHDAAAFGPGQLGVLNMTAVVTGVDGCLVEADDVDEKAALPR